MSTIDDKVKRLLKGVPEELHDIFGVHGHRSSEVYQLEEAYKRLAICEAIRKKVMDAQKKYGLPLAPNDSLERTVILVRLKTKIQEKKRSFSNYEGDENSDKGDLT